MTRHELKEQDEITSTIQKLSEFGYDRRKELITGVSILVVVILAVIGWRFYANSRDTKAESELSAAIDTFDNTTDIKSDTERFQKTLSAAEKAHADYPSLDAGIIAEYYMGVAENGLGDTAKATQDLQDAVQHGGDNIAGVAKFALAGIYEKHGNAGKALDLYKQLYDKGGYSKSAAVFEMAKLQESNNQVDEAKTYYQKVVSEFPDSPFRQEAEQALKRLGAPVLPPAPAQKPS
jgi:predicted negative regulator of RcsB-dependent stress response